MPRDGGAADIDVSTGYDRRGEMTQAGRGWLAAVRLPAWTAIAGILAVAMGTRLFAIGLEAYYIDETITIWYAQHYDALALLTVIPTTQPHPPLFYVLADVWVSLVGTGEAVTRLPSAVFGMLTVGVVALLGQRLYSSRVGLLAGMITAIAPFHVFYSQWFRMYALLGLLATVGTLLLYSWVSTDDRRSAVGYAVVAALMAATHVYGMLVIVSHLCWAVGYGIADGETDARQLALGIVPVVVGISPFAAAMVGKAIWPGVFGPVGQATLNTPLTLEWIAHAETYMLVLTPEYMGAFIVIIVLHLALILSTRRLNAETGLLWMWLALPVGLALAISLWHPIIRYKFLMAVAPAMYLLIAAGIDTIDRPPVRVAMAVVVLVSALPTLAGIYAYNQYRPYDDAAAYVEDNAAEADLVLVQSPPRAPPAFYFEHLTPATMIVDIRVEADNPQTASVLNARIAEADCVWVVSDIPTDGAQARLLDFLNEDTVESTKRFTRTRRGFKAGIEIRKYAPAGCAGGGG